MASVAMMSQNSSVDGNYYQNLFYIYENDERIESPRVNLTLFCYFDEDGDDATTDDRSHFSYRIELSGSGNGKIKRNGYYRVDVVIRGLPGDGMIFNCTVADWETPVTQSVNLGL
jgi:hypothetical protein